MGYITNYSYCTATVSSSSARAPQNTLKYIKKPCLRKITRDNNSNYSYCGGNNGSSLGLDRGSTFYLKGFILFSLSWKFTTVPLLFSPLFSPGVRTEQDLYIRLIDSMTKQVSCSYTCLHARFAKKKKKKSQNKTKKNHGVCIHAWRFNCAKKINKMVLTRRANNYHLAVQKKKECKTNANCGCRNKIKLPQ